MATVSITVDTRRTVFDLETITDRMNASSEIRRGLHLPNTRVLRRVKRVGYGFTDRTGMLRRSIRGDVVQRRGVQSGQFRSGFHAVIDSNVEYAPYVEFGYGGRYSYLRRALRAAEPEIRQELDRATDRFIARENRRN